MLNGSIGREIRDYAVRQRVDGSELLRLQRRCKTRQLPGNAKGLTAQVTALDICARAQSVKAIRVELRRAISEMKVLVEVQSLARGVEPMCFYT